MALPAWLQSHPRGPLSSAVPSFVSFTDEVARLLGLPPARSVELYERSFETDHAWLLWKSNPSGASLCLDRPGVHPRECVVIKVEWHHSPDPVVIAAMVRAYERRGRRSLLPRLLRRS
ncbi:hypothetical protein [Streptomyces sp. NPDC000880]